MGNYHARFYEGLGRGDTPSLLSSGNNSAFTYDGFGYLVKIVEMVGGTVISTKQFVSDKNDMCEARDASGKLTSQYFEYGETLGGANYFFIKDHLESVRDMVDNLGNIQAEYFYDSYGRVTKVQGTLAADFQYAGYYSHGPSGLNLTVYRAYSANLARWLNRDPIFEAGGVNLYCYVENAPINASDPVGLVMAAVCPAKKLPKPKPDPDPYPPPRFPNCYDTDCCIDVWAKCLDECDYRYKRNSAAWRRCRRCCNRHSIKCQSRLRKDPNDMYPGWMWNDCFKDTPNKPGFGG